MLNQNYYWLIPVFLLIVILIAALTVLAYYYLLQQKKIRKMQGEIDTLIDEISRLDEELKITRMKADESDRLKTAFLCNISHEIRTPLHAILGFSSLITNTGIPDGDKVNYARIINKNVDTLLELVNDILDVSQEEAGLVSNMQESFSINDLLLAIQTWLNIEKENAGKDKIQVKLSRYGKDANLVIYSDPYKLKRILTHLADNALKYSESGVIEIGYKIYDNKNLEFFVKDEGIGFSKDKLEQIMQLFRQADESEARRYQGLGIGLTIAQKFIRLLGGEMKAESEPGKGSTFWFTIPYRK